MKKIVLLLVLLLSMSASSVFAVTGGAYLQSCASIVPNSTGFIRCGSYVLGVVDNMRAQKAGGIGEYKDVCFPEKMEEEQLIQMTVDWLGTNPDSLSHWAAFGVSMAMFQNFKCGCDSGGEEIKEK